MILQGDKVVACDIDGTIWSLYELQYEYLYKYFGITLGEDEIDSWAYFYDNLPHEKADDLFAYCLNPMRMHRRNLFPGVYETMEELQANDYKVLFLSHNKEPLYMQPATKEWLYMQMPPELEFELIMTPAERCKVELLERLPLDIDAFIEDKPSTIKKGAEYGLPMKVVPRSYNQDVVGLPKTEVWTWEKHSS